MNKHAVPLTRSRILGSLLALAAAAALAAGIVACSAKKPAPTTEPPSAAGLAPAAAADYYYLLSQDFQSQGRAQDAAEALEKLAAVAPSPDVYQDLANLSWGLARPEKAREVLEAGIARFPEDKKLHFYLANSYLLHRRFDEAIQVLRDYLARHPQDQAASQELAAVMVEAGRYKDALSLLGHLPKDRRTPAMAYYESKAYSGLGKPKAAVERLRQALREDPAFLAAWSELAVLYEKEGDYRQAEEAYQRILDLGEDGQEVWMRLFKLALKQKNLDKALRILSRGAKDRAFLFEAMGTLMDQGHSEAASRYLERLARENPESADLIFIKAVMTLEREKNLEKALDLLAQIPPSSQIYDKALTTRIQLALDNGRKDLVPPLVAEGKTRFPDRPEFWFFEAVLADRENDTPRAAKILTQAVAKFPDNVEALYRLGVTQEKLKNRPEALRLMEKILTLDPGNPDALNFVGYSLAEEGRDLDRSLDLITRAIQTNPDNPYYIDSLAWVFFKRGETQKAWTEIRRATAGAVDDPTIWEHYGDIALALGRPGDAAEGYRKALEMKPANAAEIQAKLDRL